jgi:glucose-6-phosphate isomerase
MPGFVVFDTHNAILKSDMPNVSLRFDDANMYSAAVGKNGVSQREWSAMLPRLRAAKKAVQKMARQKTQGFMDLPFDRKANAECVKLASKLQRKFTDMVVLGIGGSDLGARAIYRALVEGRRKTNGRTLNLHFAGSSTDPDELTDLLSRLNLKKTCINVISKSGDTLETMTSFLFFRDRLMRIVGKRMNEHIIATTDPVSGSLHSLAKKESYAMLPIPRNVGGRFSVLSSVGLFPSAASGVDTASLLAGARTAVEAFHEHTPNECMGARYAGVHVIGMERRGQGIHVTMPYSKRLQSFAFWVRQLIAESLGKKMDRNGRVINIGPTPVAATGPEDQHSQLQLYTEGPADKLVTFIEIESFDRDIQTPDAHELGGALERFGKKSFSDLVHLERNATAESLRLIKRPNATLYIQKLDARSIGELFMFWEQGTALMGELLNIDAFNQPGVELSKSLMRKDLNASDSCCT